VWKTLGYQLRGFCRGRRRPGYLRAQKHQWWTTVRR
jgi:hypothetical protein